MLRNHLIVVPCLFRTSFGGRGLGAEAVKELTVVAFDTSGEPISALSFGAPLKTARPLPSNNASFPETFEKIPFLLDRSTGIRKPLGSNTKKIVTVPSPKSRQNGKLPPIGNSRFGTPTNRVFTIISKQISREGKLSDLFEVLSARAFHTNFSTSSASFCDPRELHGPYGFDTPTSCTRAWVLNAAYRLTNLWTETRQDFLSCAVIYGHGRYAPAIRLKGKSKKKSSKDLCRYDA
jgi:hypothetical protein